MRPVLVSIILILSGMASAQTTDDLDKKGGFKNYKIGDDFTVHGDKIKFTRNLENPDTKLYLSPEPVTVLGHSGELELTFYKFKLVEITVSFKNSPREDYQEFAESLEVLYGKPEQLKNKTKDLERFEKLLVWNGKQIGLRLGYDENYKLSEMVFFQQKGKLEKLKEEF